MLSHDVFFALKHDSSEEKEKLIEGCKTYLSSHPGVVWFAAGVLAEEYTREVNDQDFDVALHVVFKDKASHDDYQQAENHKKFIETFRENWKAVRVFDSYLNVSSHGGTET